MNKLIDTSVITRIHRKLKDLEGEEYRFVETFLGKCPELSDDVDIWLNSKEKETPHEKQKRWEGKIREIDAWLGREKRIDVHYMYTRTLELSKLLMLLSLSLNLKHHWRPSCLLKIYRRENVG